MELKITSNSGISPRAQMFERYKSKLIDGKTLADKFKLDLKKRILTSLESMHLTLYNL